MARKQSCSSWADNLFMMPVRTGISRCWDTRTTPTSRFVIFPPSSSPSLSLSLRRSLFSFFIAVAFLHAGQCQCRDQLYDCSGLRILAMLSELNQLQAADALSHFGCGANPGDMSRTVPVGPPDSAASDGLQDQQVCEISLVTLKRN